MLCAPRRRSSPSLATWAEKGKGRSFLLDLKKRGATFAPAKLLGDRLVFATRRNQATPDYRRLFELYPKAPGAFAYLPPGLCVVDLDRKKQKDGVEAWQRKYGGLPDSFTVRTPNGGLHVYLYIPKTLSVVQRLDDAAAGIDIMGPNNSITLPMSVSPIGKYEVVNDAMIDAAPVKFLLDLQERDIRRIAVSQVRVEQGKDTSRYGEAALAGILNDFKAELRASPGYPSRALNRASFRAGQLSSEIAKSTAFDSLLKAAAEYDIDLDESEQVVSNGYEAGEERPRQRSSGWRRYRPG